jgi:hypothetical protein
LGLGSGHIERPGSPDASLVPLFTSLAGTHPVSEIWCEALADRLWLACLLFLPGFILVGGWSIFNYFRLGYFGPSTFTGLGLADHSITFIQYAPDRYGAIRDVYMGVREREGTNAVNVWDGFDQIQKATGESFVQLSKTLTQMSLYLIVRHPALYFKSVAVTWVRFWNEPGWWTWPAIHSETLQIIVAYAWRAEKYFLFFSITCHFYCWQPIPRPGWL